MLHDQKGLSIAKNFLRHESAPLRLILNDQESGFVEVLQENNDIAYNQKNIQIFLTEVFKTTKNLSPPSMEGMFKSRPHNYNLKNFQELVTYEKTKVKNGLETTNFLCATIMVTFA